MKSNRGDTLLEVIVAIVLLGILAVGGLTAFGAARNTNNISNKYLQAESIATTMLEEATNLDFDYAVTTTDTNYFNPRSVDCVLKVPSNMSTTTNWIQSAKSDTNMMLTLNNISGRKASFRAVIVMNSDAYADNYNQEQFVELSTISEDNTCIIDSVGATNIYSREDGDFIYGYTTNDLKYFVQNSAGSYDNQAVQHFSELNSAYLARKWREECDRIDEFNAAHADEGIVVEYPILGEGAYTPVALSVIRAHLNKETVIEVHQNSLFSFIDVKMVYTLQQNTGSGWVSIIEDENNFQNSNRVQEYQLYNNNKFVKLENVYLMHVPLSSSYHSDKIKLINGTNISNGLDFNFYLVEQPFDSDGNEIPNISESNGNPIYAAPDIEAESLNPANRITVYTNTNLTLANIGLVNSVKQLFSDKTHILKEQYTRLYEIEVNIYDEAKNSLLCSKKTTILR